MAIGKARATNRIADVPSASWQLFEQIHHLDGRKRRVGALVARFATGAVDGLVERVAGEDAENDRNAGGAAGLRDAASGAAGDVIVMIGVAADDGAQTNDGDVVFRSCQTLGDERDFKGTGNPSDIDRVIGDTVSLKRVYGAGDKIIDDEIVKPRRDDGEAAGGSSQVAFEGGHVRHLPKKRNPKQI